MLRILLLPVTVILASCTLTHYEARGEFGDQPAVLHWKSGDSSLTLWRCEAVPVPLSPAPGDGALLSADGCIRVFTEGQPAAPGQLQAGRPVTLLVQCDDERYSPAGSYPFSPIGQRRQHTLFGLRAPDMPDACAPPLAGGP
ncbi:MAG: hypothetical protein JJT85_10870 [Chromatiales bacterium]|nr:hypothetical protein [Chromatiales bacterium]